MFGMSYVELDVQKDWGKYMEVHISATVSVARYQSLDASDGNISIRQNN
jgi:hypothetical protein